MKIPSINQGFTLIELMATLAVAAITLTLGIPSFNEAIKGNYMTSKVNELVTDINLTRSEAVKRATNVAICSRDNDSSCRVSNDWLNGWIVFVDVNTSGSLDNGDEILRVHEPLTGLTVLNFSRTVPIIYAGSGFLGGAIIANGTFTFCDSRGVSKVKGRILNKTGRLREAVDTDNNGTPDKDDGTELSCS